MKLEWIPITYRPMDEEEKKDYSERTGYDEEDFYTILNCPLPEDGETVLITDRLGNVEVDIFINDVDGCYFECNCDMEDVKAWMPLPSSYQEIKHTCSECIIKDTDACTRGNAEADEVACEDFVGGESE